MGNENVLLSTLNTFHSLRQHTVRKDSNERENNIINVHDTLDRAFGAWCALTSLKVLDALQVRTRIDFARDAMASMTKILSVPEKLFFEQARMGKRTFVELSDIVEPFFDRLTWKPGPKPVPQMCILLHTIRALAHNTSSWALVTADWDIGKTTLAQVWIPKMCEVLTLAIPLPKPLRQDDSQWKARSQGFEALARMGVLKDRQSKTNWRKNLPNYYEALLPIGEVFDGMVSHMSQKPRKISRAQEFRDYKSNTYELNNLIGVDSSGKITTAVVGAPASVPDSRLFERTELYKAMENKEDCNVTYKMPEKYIVIVDSGFTQREWVLTPFTVTELSACGPNEKRCRLYNFRLSQIRVVSENCFARLKGRWTMLRCIPFGPETSSLVVYACCCLHNFVEGKGEPMLASWLRALSANDVEPTDVAFESPSRASLLSIPCGKRRRLEAASQMGWGWEY